MSGIYGIVTKGKNIDEKAFDSLASWNYCYGNQKESEKSSLFEKENVRVRFGASRECFKESFLNGKAVFDEDTMEAFDALLFRRNEKESETAKTDETFLHELLSDGEFPGLKDVNGDFCGAYFDKSNLRLYLFRDHMGVRPLYYYIKDNFLVFSTDIRGITSLDDVDAAVNEEWLYKLFSGLMYMNADRTELEMVKCVPPGSVVSVDFSGNEPKIKTEYYWIPGSKKIRFSTDEEYFKELRCLVEDAVKIRMDAIEGPIGAEFSGGLDSSVISILMNRFKKDCTFFSWIPSADEVPVVENDERIPIFDICKQENMECDYGKLVFNLGKNSSMYKRTPLEIPKEDMGKKAALRYAFPPFMNTLEIGETAEYMHEKGIRAVFSGHGGDEGISHRCSPYELFHSREYRQFLSNIWRMTYKDKFRILSGAKKVCICLSRGHKKKTSAFLAESEVSGFLNPDFLARGKKFKKETLTFEFDPVEYIKNGGSRNRLDVGAVYGALCELRYIYPYVDYRLIDFALGIPRYLYINGYQNRYIFRMAFKDIMPKSLFRLQNKKEISVKKYKETVLKQKQLENPELFEGEKGFSKEEKESLINSIDRRKWEKYLNYDALEDWIKCDENVAIDEEALFFAISICAVTENMINKSKEVLIGKE